MNITVISPYDDNKLVFNKETERYELAFEYVKGEFENTFKNDHILKQRITKNSRVVYNYIYAKGNTQNKLVVLFMLNYTKGGREFLFNALKEQMEADITSGYNDIGNLSPINFANGQVINRDEIHKNMVCPACEDVIYASADYIGINIVYAGVYSSGLFLLAQKGIGELQK